MSESFFARMNAGFSDPERVFKFEETCVKKLLTKAGVTLRLPQWRREVADRDNSTRLHLDWMLERWPQFPIRLVTSKYQYPGKLSYARLLGGQLSKLKVLSDYLELAAHHEVNLKKFRFGLIFKCQRARSATIQVLHNQPSQSTIVTDFDVAEKEDGAHCRRFMFWYRRQHYVLEGIDSFMGTIGKDWATDD